MILLLGEKLSPLFFGVEAMANSGLTARTTETEAKDLSSSTRIVIRILSLPSAYRPVLPPGLLAGSS